MGGVVGGGGGVSEWVVGVGAESWVGWESGCVSEEEESDREKGEGGEGREREREERERHRKRQRERNRGRRMEMKGQRGTETHVYRW